MSRRDVSSAPVLAGLVAAKLVVGAWVLHRGFTHVSDDDYARTVIAEQFAHGPRLDPSATSWLPFPFWVTGAAMVVAGRSLDVARALSLVLGAASVAAPYAAMVAAQVPRLAAGVAVAGAMLLPWNVWLGAATVPEGWVGALIAGAAIAVACPRARPWAAAALLAASLSRYEAWPACAVMAAFCGMRAARGDHRAREMVCAAVAAAGPLGWMMWNRHAHGDTLHFLARVSAFRQAVGAARIPLLDKLLGYPRALVDETPEAVVLGILGAIGVAASAALRARWAAPAAVALATLAFLIVGDVGDGAPTHHPARALVPVWWILVGMGVDALFALLRAGRARAELRGRVRDVFAWRGAVAAALVLGAAWCVGLAARLDAFPGRGEGERREVQIARGLDMRARAVARAWIAPCAFEHFALIAAWGAPERADVGARTGEPAGERCPRVVER